MFSQCRTCFSIKHIFLSARKSTHEKLRYKFCTILTRYHKKEEKKQDNQNEIENDTLFIFFFYRGELHYRVSEKESVMKKENYLLPPLFWISFVYFFLFYTLLSHFFFLVFKEYCHTPPLFVENIIEWILLGSGCTDRDFPQCCLVQRYSFHSTIEQSTIDVSVCKVMGWFVNKILAWLKS